ncbi:AraC family transcriptional regulator [Bacillus sp. SD088]|uniref:AraC family transcriptional regulator n=1 Tax=Bacillus sp. SD088 TaxID=2782012 RepID=UPI001A95EB2B|nr:AraC family transcriptional regulator [Bacillus sp. SD088]MBO0993242.1 AraC family transcriptional regulator [Bacillus sp. SD088]
MSSLYFQQMSIQEQVIPLHLVTIGSNNQPYLNRPVGLPYHQIFLATEGKGIFRLFGVGDFELLPGEVIIIPAGTSHEYFPLSRRTWELGFVGFDGKLADTVLGQLNFQETKKMTIRPFSVIWKNIEQLWFIAKKNEEDAQWHASKYLYSLLLELKKLSEVNYGPENDSYSPNEHVQKVADFIRTHYAKPLRVASLSNMAGYSNHHFTRLFRKTYGMTPHQYLEKIRFERSKFLLEEEKNLLVSEVATRVGMEENYFIRLFKKKYGMTPGAYRAAYERDGS